jgi:hypothetical protein
MECGLLNRATVGHERKQREMQDADEHVDMVELAADMDDHPYHYLEFYE